MVRAWARPASQEGTAGPGVRWVGAWHYVGVSMFAGVWKALRSSGAEIR